MQYRIGESKLDSIQQLSNKLILRLRWSNECVEEWPDQQVWGNIYTYRFYMYMNIYQTSLTDVIFLLKFNLIQFLYLTYSKYDILELVFYEI